MFLTADAATPKLKGPGRRTVLNGCIFPDLADSAAVGLEIIASSNLDPAAPEPAQTKPIASTARAKG